LIEKRLVRVASALHGKNGSTVPAPAQTFALPPRASMSA
jgi:hypothetical protein